MWILLSKQQEKYRDLCEIYKNKIYFTKYADINKIQYQPISWVYLLSTLIYNLWYIQISLISEAVTAYNKSLFGRNEYKNISAINYVIRIELLTF